MHSRFLVWRDQGHQAKHCGSGMIVTICHSHVKRWVKSSKHLLHWQGGVIRACFGFIFSNTKIVEITRRCSEQTLFLLLRFLLFCRRGRFFFLRLNSWRCCALCGSLFFLYAHNFALVTTDHLVLDEKVIERVRKFRALAKPVGCAIGFDHKGRRLRGRVVVADRFNDDGRWCASFVLYDNAKRRFILSAKAGKSEDDHWCGMFMQPQDADRRNGDRVSLLDGSGRQRRRQGKGDWGMGIRDTGDSKTDALNPNPQTPSLSLHSLQTPVFML